MSPVPKRSADRMASKVDPPAPFIAMPSDIEALSGDTNTLAPEDVFAICWKSANEKSFPDVAICCSLPDRFTLGACWPGPSVFEHAVSAPASASDAAIR